MLRCESDADRVDRKSNHLSSDQHRAGRPLGPPRCHCASYNITQSHPLSGYRGRSVRPPSNYMSSINVTHGSRPAILQSFLGCTRGGVPCHIDEYVLAVNLKIRLTMQSASPGPVTVGPSSSRTGRMIPLRCMFLDGRKAVPAVSAAKPERTAKREKRIASWKTGGKLVSSCARWTEVVNRTHLYLSAQHRPTEKACCLHQPVQIHIIRRYKCITGGFPSVTACKSTSSFRLLARNCGS